MNCEDTILTDPGNSQSSVIGNPENCGDRIIGLRGCSSKFFYSPSDGHCSCEKEGAACKRYWDTETIERGINEYLVAEGIKYFSEIV